MRKPNNTGGGAGKGRPFKGKEGDRKSARPAASRSGRDEGRSSGQRKPRAEGSEDRPKRTYERSERPTTDRKPRTEGFDDRPRRTSDRSERPASGRKPKPYGQDDKPTRSFDRSDAKPAFRKRSDDERPPSGRKPKPRNFDSDKPRRSFDNTDEKPAFRKGPRNESSFGVDKFAGRSSAPRSSEEKPRRKFESSEERTTYNKETRDARGAGAERNPRRDSESSDKRRAPGAKFDSNARKYGSPKFSDSSLPERKTKVREKDDDAIKRVKFDDFEDGKVFSNTDKNRKVVNTKPSKNKTKYKKATGSAQSQSGDGLTRLNKYLSNAGIASRRDADTLIQSGVVKVNGVVVDQLGYKISAGDKVTYGDAAVKGERKVYLLLNKPKDYITTVDDPQERKTVMDLISKACKERIYPVGRLDRNTTGLLLFTNDGDLTTRLTHPKFGVKKVYHVSLNKGLKPDDFKSIAEGLELEDGIVKADDVAFVGEGKKEIGIEIHSGRNRIVRRIFEHLGYEVLKLDRVVFAGLTKKDLPRGKHRFLTAKEIGFLQMIG